MAVFGRVFLCLSLMGIKHWHFKIAFWLLNCVCVQQTHGLRESPIETVNLKRDHHELIMIVIQTIVMLANCL